MELVTLPNGQRGSHRGDLLCADRGPLQRSASLGPGVPSPDPRATREHDVRSRDNPAFTSAFIHTFTGGLFAPQLIFTFLAGKSLNKDVTTSPFALSGILYQLKKEEKKKKGPKLMKSFK